MWVLINGPSPLGGIVQGDGPVIPHHGPPMSSEHPDRQTTPDDEVARTLAVPRWAVGIAGLIVLMPFFIMSLMMVMMGMFGPPIQGRMAGPGPGLFVGVGVIPLLLVLGAFSGLYWLYQASTE